jgi:hypothetical protein
LWSGINEADSFCCFSVFFISISIPSGDISAGVQRIKQSAGKDIVSQRGERCQWDFVMLEEGTV